MTRRGVRIGGLLRTRWSAARTGLPDGRIRCFLRAKSKREPYDLAVPWLPRSSCWPGTLTSSTHGPKRPGCLTASVSAPRGRFWRNDLGRPLTYQTWTTELKQACVSAGLPVYTSHAFRRAFATTSTTVASRATVAIAGNWTSTRRMDDHYVQPSITRLRQSVARLPSRPQQALPVETDSPVLLPGRPTAMTQRALGSSLATTPFLAIRKR